LDNFPEFKAKVDREQFVDRVGTRSSIIIKNHTDVVNDNIQVLTQQFEAKQKHNI